MSRMSVERIEDWECFRKGDTFHSPRVDFRLILWNELSKETWAVKATATGKGRPGGEQQDTGTQEDCSATWLAVLGFMVMGLVYGLSLASHSD